MLKSKKDKKNDEPRGLKFLGGLLLSKMARGGAARLRSKADDVNRLNVFPVPDGDTGDNMRMTIESGIAAIENLDTDDLAEVMRALSHGMLLGARGNSGVILSQFFAGAADGFDGKSEADPVALGIAFKKGVDKAYRSVMTPTEGTILTVARESVDYAVSKITEESTVRSFFADLVKEMHDSLERTPDILEVLREANVVDSGGAGLFYIIDGFNRALNGEEIPTDNVDYKKTSSPLNTSFGPDSVMEYGYCTELLIQLMSAKTDIESFDIEPLKTFLCEIGNSVVCFMTGSIVKLHVHTMTPEKVLEYCRSFGEFITIKIENMSVQHTESEEKKPVEKLEEAPKAKHAVIAVCSGDGIEELFKEFGANEIIHGGQTHNPSTSEFIEAFEKVNAENIFVLPNNGNVLMAACQAAELYKLSKVYVIPSKNIGTGYAALSVVDFSSTDALAIATDMENSLKGITSAYFSPSVRDANIDGIKINRDDYIGIIEKKIVTANSDPMEALKALVSALLIDSDRSFVNIFCGKGSNEELNSSLEAYISEYFPSVEAYFIESGHDVYPYIFTAE